MRKKTTEQLPLTPAVIKHDRAEEIEIIGHILDENPIIYDMAHADLTRGHEKKDVGANGMSAEQVVKAAIIKQLEGFSYEDLSFHLMDSQCYRKFCRIGFADDGFSSSALCANIKALSPETWEAMNGVLVGHSKDTNVEKGREVRFDCTVVSSNIHDPRDSEQLWDGVRVLARILSRVNESKFTGVSFPFTDHTKRAKKRRMGILNAKTKKDRKKLYEDLIKVTKKTVSYSQCAISELIQFALRRPGLKDAIEPIIAELHEYNELTLKVIDQTERRVMQNENVHAQEKVVSIFEPHTDIIIKDRRETLYGHKICLAGGRSNLILDCMILDGNPSDSTLVEDMLDRQKETYGRYPLKVALDGGFASKDNLGKAKSRGIKDVCFSKSRGMSEEDMCRSKWVYKRLRRFRAGIESGISWLKRYFGMGLCTWKGHRSFKSYVWSCIVSANLLTLARQRLRLNAT